MSKRKSTGLPKRDLFNADHGQAGKGDKERSSTWREHLDGINFPGVVGFQRTGANTLRKTYGTPATVRFADAPAGIVH